MRRGESNEAGVVLLAWLCYEAVGTFKGEGV